MKKKLTLFLSALFTLVSLTSILAQNSFSVKYIAATGGSTAPPEYVKVEADYDRHSHIISPPNSSTQTIPVLESKYVINGTTVPYLSAPTTGPTTGQTFELYHLKVTWNSYQGGVFIPVNYIFKSQHILSANSGAEVEISTQQGKLRLKAIYSGTHVLYQITNQTN